MSKAGEVLAQAFGTQNWTIEKPQDGLQKECYIATDGIRTVFVKFDVPTTSLQRLSDLGVAPRVLAAGTYQGVNYVIQEFLAGTYPDRPWITAHVTEVASLVRIYHEDKQLTDILTDGQHLSYRKHLDNDLDALEQKIEGLVNTQDVYPDFRTLKALAHSFDDVPLVPVHNEPNTTNMLLRDGKLTFIDWDEVLLSDPLRDIGTFLWWYLPVHQWVDFFRADGTPLTPPTEAKIYWFAARASLAIYLWHLERGYMGSGFDEDFRAALNRQPNPHTA